MPRPSQERPEQLISQIAEGIVIRPDAEGEVMTAIRCSDELAIGDFNVQQKWSGDVKKFTLARLHARLYGKPIPVRPQEQTVEAVKAMTELHYDERIIVNMIGPSLFYSCAYFKEVDDLDIAQVAKAALITNKILSVIGRRRRARILEIGGGYGTLAIYLANELDADVTVVTNSVYHARVIRARIARGEVCRGSVTVLLRDFRRIPENLEKFDAIVSVGMLEHVGAAQVRHFMEIVEWFLKPDGVVLLHFIYAGLYSGANPWINLRIFPGGELLLRAQVEDAVEGLLNVIDIHIFQNHDYERTADAWGVNLDKGRRTSKGVLMPDHHLYPLEQWLTMRYFAGYISALFASRRIGLVQILAGRDELPGYMPIR